MKPCICVSVYLSVCLSVHRLMCILWLFWSYCLSYHQTLLPTLSDCHSWQEHSKLWTQPCQSPQNLLRYMHVKSSIYNPHTNYDKVVKIKLWHARNENITYMCLYVFITYTHANVHTQMHVYHYTYMHIHTCMHTHTHTCTHARMHAHTCTNI